MPHQEVEKPVQNPPIVLPANPQLSAKEAANETSLAEAETIGQAGRATRPQEAIGLPKLIEARIPAPRTR